MLLLDKLLERLLYNYYSLYIITRIKALHCTFSCNVLFSCFFSLFYFLLTNTINSKLERFHVKWKRNKNICLLFTPFNNYKRKYITSLNTVKGKRTRGNIKCHVVFDGPIRLRMISHAITNGC